MCSSFFMQKKSDLLEYERRNTGLCKSILQAVLGIDTWQSGLRGILFYKLS